MNDNPMRDVFVDDIFTDEPPIGSIVAGSTQRGLALRRRRRFRGFAGGLAGVAVIAVGIPLAVGGLTGSHSGGPPTSTPDAAATRSPLPLPTTQSTEQPPPPPPGFSLPLPTPTVPAQHLTGDQVPVTAKSVVQLLIDVLPPSITKTSHYLGNANEGGAGVAMAALRTGGPTGTGSVQVIMTRPGSPALSCADEQFHGSNGLIPSVACQIFHLSGGVSVIESVNGAQFNGWCYFYTVGVRRADGSIVKVAVANYDVTAGLKQTPSAQLPLTMDQTLAAAADPRWALTADRSFVEAAAHIKIGIFA